MTGGTPRPRRSRTERAAGRLGASFVAAECRPGQDPGCAAPLLRRYQHAGPAAKAVLQAAIDILRLGHGRYLPEPMLEEAAVGYIDQHDWDQLDDDWYTTALDGLTAPHRRMPGPLIPHRPRPGDVPTTHRLYRLADFLEQHGRSERQHIPPPATVWTAARNARRPTDLFRLAQAAFAAGGTLGPCRCSSSRWPLATRRQPHTRPGCWNRTEPRPGPRPWQASWPTMRISLTIYALAR